MKTYHNQSLRFVFSAALLSCTAALFAPLHGQSMDPSVLIVDLIDETPAPEMPPPPPPAPAGKPSRLGNVSMRVWTGAGEDAATLGLVLNGEGPKQLLVRGVGPTLASFGVTNYLPDPVILSFDGQINGGTSGSWDSNEADVPNLSDAFGQAGAFALSPQSGDVAYMGTVDPSVYTMSLTSAGGGSGVALAEIYDLDGDEEAAQIVNFSARAHVGEGEQVLIAGFTLSGEAPRSVLVRAVGPALEQFGIGGVLAAPQLSVYDGNGVLVAQNQGWSGDPALESVFSNVGAFALASDSSDAALVVTLPAGSYSVQVSSLDGATGQALAEVYLVP